MLTWRYLTIRLPVLKGNNVLSGIKYSTLYYLMLSYAIFINLPLPIVVFIAFMSSVKCNNILSSSMCYQCPVQYLICSSASSLLKR